jgi:hypothetical protein
MAVVEMMVLLMMTIKMMMIVQIRDCISTATTPIPFFHNDRFLKVDIIVEYDVGICCLRTSFRRTGICNLRRLDGRSQLPVVCGTFFVLKASTKAQKLLADGNFEANEKSFGR